MRLINTNTLQFEEVFDYKTIKYAILSHRWGDQEVAYQEWEDRKQKPGSGLSNIRGFCSLAKERGLRYAWIDTCCIDKKSSAELSEAINSIYQWYEGAEECYVYLSDVVAEHEGEAYMQQFRESAWFTRGWTLQELLAPFDVTFFDCQWRRIGTKAEMRKVISEVTGIEAKHLKKDRGLELHPSSVAAKMSWVSKRQTSREEDMAYCLLGLFDVNMPLLYGERGRKAFLRLQLEIIKNSDDESIFAWTDFARVSGMFATRPSCFEHSGDIRETRRSLDKPYVMTNKGLQFYVKRNPHKDLKVPLHCSRWASEERLAVTITLRHNGDEYYRTTCNELELSKDDREGAGDMIYVREPKIDSQIWDSYKNSIFEYALSPT